MTENRRPFSATGPEIVERPSCAGLGFVRSDPRSRVNASGHLDRPEGTPQPPISTEGRVPAGGKGAMSKSTGTHALRIRREEAR